MATFADLMAQLRAAHERGDVEGAKLLAAQARQMKAAPIPADLPTPAPPQGIPAPDFMRKITEALVAPAPPAVDAPPPADGFLPDIPFDQRAMPRQTPFQQPAPARPAAPAPMVTPAPAAPLAQIAQAMTGTGADTYQPDVPFDPRAMPGVFPATRDPIIAAMQPAMPVAAAPDPFAGEGFGALAARRGQQFAQGAADVVASVPEAIAIANQGSTEDRRKTIPPFIAELTDQARQIEARLADPRAASHPLRQQWERELLDVQGQISEMQTALDQAMAAPDSAAKSGTFAKGDAIRNAAGDLFGKPDPRDTGFWSQVAQGAGNMTGMIAASAAGGLVAGAPGALAVGAGTGAAMNAPSLYKEALEAGADEETAIQAARWGGVIGLGEIIPISRALKVLPPRLRGKVSNAFLRTFIDIAQGAGEEAAQEYLATVANNIVAQGLYDPERGWTDGATESALVGAVLGSGVGAMGSALEGGKRAGESVTRPPEPVGRKTPATTLLPSQPDRAPAVAPPPTAPAPAAPDAIAQIAGAMVPPTVDAKSQAKAALEAFARATKGAAIPSGSEASRQFDRIVADAERAGLTSDEIDVALSGRPATPAAQAALGQPITRTEAEADPERFEIVDESEGQGRDWHQTGNQVVIDRQTGQVRPLAPVDASATAPGDRQPGLPPTTAPQPETPAAPDPVQQIASAMTGQPQASPVEGRRAEPAAGPTTEAEAVQAGGGVAPPQPQGIPNQPRNFEFIDAAGVQKIGTEPGVMQYKAGGDADGVTDRLRGITEWRPERAGVAIIYEYADGRRVIADGHQRLGLAKRLAGEGKPIQMPAMILRQADGVTPEQARVTAALKNIAEGSGTALDAAKVLRGSTETVQSMALPPSSAIVRDALGMRDLSDKAFGMVVNGLASERDGGIVGRVVTNKDAQANILAMLARLQKDRPISAFQAESVARQAAADTVEETQDSLFGPETDTQNLYLERAKILEAAIRMVREDERAFKNVVANADRLQAAGNQLDADGNKAVVDKATTLRDYLQREANTKGPISDALSAAARAHKGGATLAAATREFLDAAERVAAGGLVAGQRSEGGSGRPSGDSGEQPAGSDRPQEPGAQAQAVTPPAEPDQDRDDAAAIGDMFGGPAAPPAPAPDPKADIVSAMTGQKPKEPEAKPAPQAPTPAPADWLDTGSTSKTPEQVRAEAEAKVRADQSKMRKPGGNSGDAGPMFNPDQDLFDPPKQAPQTFATVKDLAQAVLSALKARIKRDGSAKVVVSRERVLQLTRPDQVDDGFRAAADGIEVRRNSRWEALGITEADALAEKLGLPSRFEAVPPKEQPADLSQSERVEAEAKRQGVDLDDADYRVILSALPDRATDEDIAAAVRDYAKYGAVWAQMDSNARYDAVIKAKLANLVRSGNDAHVWRIADSKWSDLTEAQRQALMFEIPEPGERQPRAPQTGAELIQQGRAILQAHSSADDPDRVVGNDDMSESPEGLALADALLKAKDMPAKKKVAAEWVLKHGKDTGKEHLVVLGRDGIPLAIMRGTKGNVSALPAVFRAGFDGAVTFSVHNHPSSSSLSGGDLAMAVLWKGHTLMVVPHNGTRTHEIRFVDAVDIAPDVRGRLQNATDAATFHAIAEAFSDARGAANAKLNWQVNELGRGDPDGGAERFYRAERALFQLVLAKAGMIDYTDAKAHRETVDAEGINFEGIYGQISGNVVDRLRRAGLSVPESGDSGGNRPADGGADTASPGTDGADQQPAQDAGQGDGSGRVPAKPVGPAKTGNAALDGALDDIFGSDDDVSGTGNDLERGGRDGTASDGVGGTDVPHAAGGTGRGNRGRGGASSRAGRRGQSDSGSVSGDNAPAVGAGGNPQPDSAGRPDRQPAASGDGGRRDGDSPGRLPSDTGRGADPADNASGAPRKLTAAQQLAAIRNALKEDAVAFVREPGRRSTDSEAFRRWFGDSKVVDADGEPLVLWHGTARRLWDQDFDAFRGMVWASEGSFLPMDYAAMRANRIGADQAQERLIDLYMRVERPFDADLGMPKAVTVGDMITAMIEQAEAQGRRLTEGDLAELRSLADIIQKARRREESGPHYSRHDFWYQPADYFGRDGAQAIRDAFRITGFDGIKMLEGGEQTWGAFGPTQVKSPQNVGTFDPNDPVIFREDPANPIDPRKAEAIYSIIASGESLAGVNVAQATDRDLFRAIIMPLREAGMTRAEVAELTPYLEAFLADLRAGRVSLEASAIDRLNAVVPGWSAVGNMLTNPDPDRGGIIDKAIKGKWFVILNGSERSADGMDTADQAVDWFIANHAKPDTAKADKVRVIPADRDNIDKTLPLLLPVQRDDVFKVETRFAKPDGHGFMLTNGTGTGKTYSGSGVIKRFYQQGKKNILIIAPDATHGGWEKTLGVMGIPASRLTDTKDAGEGVVFTTHQNAGANDALASRDWDLVVVDEAQFLSQNKDGGPTGALETVRAITLRPEDLWRKSRMMHAEDWARQAAMKDGDAKTAAYHRLLDRERREVEALAQKPRPKALFLSATPFAYDKSIDYAEGYLFEYPKDGHVGNSRQDGRAIFMVNNFGYRIRYHKLTKPEHAVDSAVFEREFHEKLKRDGVLSGRSLQVDVDYDRRFVTVADAIGTEIDAILNTMSEGMSHSDKAIADGYKTLRDLMKTDFGYLVRQQLLEAIKGKAAIPDIQKHLDMDRKVVVFHDFNVGGGFNPFEGLRDHRILGDANALAALGDLTAKNPGWDQLDFTGYPAPADGLKAAFGKRAGVFSGLTKKDRDQQLAEFNRDGSGVDVLIVQADAGGAGVSMHDLTGTHQRVLINLGMPTKPTTTLQQEGRILRVGTKTNAAFRYYTIGTTWERTAFAQRIAERSGTVENLALGNEARAITDAFVDAYMDAEAFDPSPEDGKGGKEKDRAKNVTTPWQKAISYYFGRMRTTGRRDQRQGLDFYPTPEPLGLKMVEWAGIRANERVLEPSAGDGAIARFMPDDAAITIVEPSPDLGSTAQLRAPRANLVETTFENHHISNKYHAIVMNPPFGSGGKTAMEHLAKAAKHLRKGGRIVALIPSGPSADKRFDAWYESDEAKGISLSAEVALPAVTFERAGTGVMSRVVILDKLDEGQEVGAGQRSADLRSIGTTKDLFDRIENMTVARRPAPVQDVLTELEAEGEDATTPPPDGRPSAPIAGDVQFKLAQTKHGKTGEALFVASIVNKLEREAYLSVLAVAKGHGGWYSSFRGAGAIPGFQFKSEAARQAFIDDMSKPTMGGFEETAYHGTPHDFDRFSLDRIGTGEGAQVFGWGLYFAGRREVSEWYRKKLSGKNTTAIPADLISALRAVDYLGFDTIGQAIAAMRRHADWADRWDVPASDQGAISDALARYEAEAFHNRGRLFTVDIPGPENLLAWDAPLVDQPEAVKQALRDLLPDAFGGKGESIWTEEPETAVTLRAWRDQFGYMLVDHGDWFAVIAPNGVNVTQNKKLADAKRSAQAARKHHTQNMTGELAYRMLSSQRGGDRAASEALRAAGIPGHRYLDGNSRSAGTGAHNFVIYDDAAIQVIAKEQRRQLVREAAAATEEIRLALPALRAELDRLDLKRVRLSAREGDPGWQGAFAVTGDGEMEIVIGASLDPVATLHHEVIHALRAMNLFTPEEWQALTLAAEKRWLVKHDIAARYPDLSPEQRIEEAIAEEFSQALAKRESPRGSILVRAFNKIVRLLRAFRTVMTGKGYSTPEAIFGAVLAGEIAARGRFKGGIAQGGATQAQEEPAITRNGTPDDAPLFVVRIDGAISQDEVKATARRALDALVGQGMQTADGTRIEVTKKSAGKLGAFPKGDWQDRAMVAANLDRVLGSALVYGSAPDSDRRGTLSWQYAAAHVSINGEPAIVRFSLRQIVSEGRTVAYDMQGYDVVRLAVSNADGAVAGQSNQPPSSRAITLAQALASIKAGVRRFQRPPLAVRPLTPQGRAHRNSALGATPFIPDRRVWETLTAAGIPIWQRLRDLPGAASDAVDRARGVIQDRMLPFLRAQEAVERSIGRKLGRDHDAYTAETTFSGKVGRHLLEIDEEFTKPIIQIIAASKGRMDADSVGEWLYARHAIERNAYIATINPLMPDGGSGMTDADAQAILAAAAASPDAAAYDRIGHLIDQMRERSLKLREDAGLISNHEAQMWRVQYNHYVPLKGFEETDHYESLMDLRGVSMSRRFSVRGGETRRALGRRSEAFNPLQSAITQAQEVAIRAEKNRVAQRMYDLANDYPSKALWDVKKPKQKRYFNRTTGLVETRVEDPVSMILEPNEMAVKISGQEHRILFNDERLARAAGTLGADQMSGALRILSMFSRFFSMTRTMLNPEFMVTNAFRDFQAAHFNIQAFGEQDRNRIAQAMTKNWRKAFMGAMRGSTYRFDTEWSKHYREFQKAGAQVWFWTMENPEAARDDLDQRIRLARGSKAVRALKVMTTPSAFFSFRDNAALSFIERTNLAVDNAIRLAAFVEARKLGWDVEKAAFLAKELTVNFNRRGEAGATMNALYPFFNAAIQGTVRTLKAISSRRVAMMVLTAFAGGLLLDLINAALSEEDDDGELLYDKVPDYRNERNLHFVLWGTGENPAAIPMPYGYNVFPYAGQQLGKVIRGVKPADKAFGDVVAAAFGAFSPISAATPAQMVSPVISDPIVEIAENKNWLGAPIYPETFGNQTAPDAYVHFRGATEVSKWVAQSVNGMTGGDFRQPGAIDVSPETLDHLASFAVGSAGAFWGRSADMVAKALQGDFESIQKRQVPFLRNVTSPVEEWIDRDRYYRFRGEVRKAQADLKAYQAAGATPPARTVALAGLYQESLKADRELSGKGEWNPSKPGALAARGQGKVYLDFNGKYLSLMGRQGE